MKPNRLLSTTGKEMICTGGSSYHDVLLCAYSYAGVLTTGGRPRAAKCVRPVLDSSVEEESVAKTSSRTGETSLRV